MFNLIVKMLPNNSDNGNNNYWSNGIFILCKTEEMANELADCLDELDYQTLTGYYDPIEDKRNNEVDECTGYWYVDIN